MREIPFQIGDEHGGESALDLPVGLGLRGLEAQAIALPLAQQVSADFDGGKIAPPEQSGGEQRYQQTVAEVLGPAKAPAAGGAVRLLHQLNAVGKELIGRHTQ